MRTFLEHIVKHGSGYRLLSHKGKNLGTFKSKGAAAKHEGEVEYFKTHKESAGVAGTAGGGGGFAKKAVARMEDNDHRDVQLRGKEDYQFVEDAIEDVPSMTAADMPSKQKEDEKEKDAVKSFKDFSEAFTPKARVLRESEHDVFASELGLKPLTGAKNQKFAFPESIAYGGRTWTKRASGGEFWNGDVLEAVRYADPYGNILRVKNDAAPLKESFDGSLNAVAKADRVCDGNNCTIQQGERFAIAVDPKEHKTLHLCRNCAAVFRRRLAARSRYGAMRSLGMVHTRSGMWESADSAPALPARNESDLGMHGTSFSEDGVGVTTEDKCIYCADNDVDPKYAPYCSKGCAAQADDDAD